MKKQIILSSLLTIFIVFISCKTKNINYQKEAANADLYRAGLVKIVDIITHDIFAPPVASRIFTYASIAGYEAQIPGNPKFKSFTNQLNGLKPALQPEAGAEYCFPVCGSIAMMKVGKALTFSGDSIEVYRTELIKKFEKLGVPNDVMSRSIAYGDAVGNHILTWAANDNYKELRTATKYAVKFEKLETWKPTGPMYSDALEPHWGEMRTLVLDSASQFRPERPAPFSKEKGSLLYKQAMEVYDSVANNNDFTRETAKYWDDNAMATEVTGHVMMTKKKISPGGHWIMIADNVTRQKGYDVMQTAETFAMVSIGLYEAFISCWKEKYESEYIRPETYINQFINKEWTPFLQTPPFPEYTSGHSVITGSAATILTEYIGDNYTFSDSTEMYLNFKPRTYNSFMAASNEAALSRMYGGIHFRPAIENGQTQGKAVGKYIISKIKTKN